MRLSSETKMIEVIPDISFSTDRILIGNFDAASECLKKGLKELGNLGLFSKRPSWHIYPKELVSSQLSQVEDRIFRELALSVGAAKVEVFK